MKKKQPYQFIPGFGSGGIAIFDYPKSDSQIGSISSPLAAQGECTDVTYGTGKKTFWVTSSTSAPGAIDEFKVLSKSGTLIATLNTPSGDIPVGCAMSPTGDLAATSVNNGHVDIFKGAKGSATQSSTPLIEAFFPGYDTKGNLYVDGFNSDGGFGFVELPKGKTTWITLSGASIEFPGGVQFDGKYITINDQEAHDIFGYTCSGTTCTLKRTVALMGSSDCDQTWIAKGYVICPDAGNSDVEIFKYPAGGSIVKTLTGSFSEPLGAVQAEK
jgi:hypothetical protein